VPVDTNSQPRVAVFIDYQNVSRTAREAFGWEDQGMRWGNFKPLPLGRYLCGCVPGRKLEQVRVYTGVPSNERDQKGYQAMQRRLTSWKVEGGGCVEPFDRTLKYGNQKQKPREKGIDVLLAIDFVRLAIEDAYDVGVLFSADTDLVPALEYVTDKIGHQNVETAIWAPTPPNKSAEPLGVATIPGEREQIVRRTVAKREFDRMADKRDFNLQYQASQPAPGQSGRRLPPGRI
jgi:uncharacterized LabA/DUF88 family protein